jgi:hypothetical protein
MLTTGYEAMAVRLMHTAAISSIEIAPNYGTSFNQYSSFALYGIKGA